MATEHVRVVIVGTGFSGLGAAIRLKERGVAFTILERGHDVGGTWRDNTYPGCRCDVPSHLYSFSFAPNPGWTELFSPQPEIHAYLRRTAADYAILPDVRFGVALTEATWNEEGARWALETTAGPLTCDVLVLGNGPLSEPAYPDIDGLDEFAGPVMHSARWDDDVSLDGKRVAIVGTGASAIQFLPHVQQRAATVSLFQRTAPWVLPHFNRRITPLERQVFRRVPAVQRAFRLAIYGAAELGAVALTRQPRLTGVLRVAGLNHLRRHVRDPEKRRKLTPDFQPGCKRLLMSNDFYRAVDQTNVEVVTERIVAVEDGAVVTAEGQRHDVDVIILGTGFRVIDNPAGEMIRGRDDTTLAKFWSEGGVRAHLGATIPGFPNLMFLAGPNTGIGHTSLVVMIEAQVRYVMGCLAELERRGASTFEVQTAPFDAYNEDIQRRMRRTVWNTGGCSSWYLDDEGRNPTLWPDFTFRFVQRTRRFDAESYEFGRVPVLSPRLRQEV
ncbi:MAG: flavin-containing monooxygenase [Acidimicrobiales bacterium]